jgi:hypothetical protein
LLKKYSCYKLLFSINKIGLVIGSVQHGVHFKTKTQEIKEIEKIINAKNKASPFG